MDVSETVNQQFLTNIHKVSIRYNDQPRMAFKTTKKPGQTAEQLRGYTCPQCGQLGQHFEDRCPVKAFVGVPEVQRKAMQEAAIEEAYGPLVDDATPPGFISGMELQCILQKRTDVPPYLRCAACCLLATDAVWCQQCDAIMCSTCLAPPDETWVCPVCRTYVEDNFHVVKALREMASAWMRATAMDIDTKMHIV